uniref:Uncharacterized protein n=1 Tax=Anguilla anguilla TaxID=7936 RepID=A0A0E9SA31_ANGAN
MLTHCSKSMMVLLICQKKLCISIHTSKTMKDMELTYFIC